MKLALFAFVILTVWFCAVCARTGVDPFAFVSR